MSPTAYPGELSSSTSKSVSSPSADTANASFNRHHPPFPNESASVAGRKTSSGNENHGKEPEPLPTIIAVNPTHPGWYEKKENGENKESTQGKSMEINSSQNDLRIQLARHKYTKDGKQMFFICADYDHGYTESKNTRIRKASKLDILKSLLEAVKIGRSVVFYYSGHCGSSGRGNSTVTFKNGHWEYEEDGAQGPGEPCRAFIRSWLAVILTTSLQIYCPAREIEEVLSEGLEQNGGRKVTIMLIFDTCHAATFFDKVFEFSRTYRAKEIGGVEKKVPGEHRLGESQLIFIAATEFNQKACTFKQENSKEENGAMTQVMAEFLADPEVPKTVEELVEQLYRVCHERQAPQVRSLLPEPDLRLLLA
ncbi:hypothetical protein FRC01_011767 [Tulasnella sp. 417]|nr:hypothetical protein FRC01_011767 [Tulasnella sp. 417]